MGSRYNIYYAGEVLAGHNQATVREQLRKLFKASDAVLDKLFSGSEQLVKRECDKATALKYKQAMEQAGAQPVIKVVRDDSTAAAAASPEPAPERKPTTAERVAALASAPDVGLNAAEPPQAAEPEIDEETGWQLEPVGADILRPDERRQPIVAAIDISALDLAADTGNLAPARPPAPAAPATDHLSMGAVGDSIPTLPSDQAPLHPDTSAIALSPEGTDFADCAPPEPTPPQVDLSSMDLAPEGSDVLEEKYRNKPAPVAPTTDHISLED